MLLHIHQLSDSAWLGVSYELISALNNLINDDPLLIEFISSMSKSHLLEYVIGLHGALTIQIVMEDVNNELLEETIKLMDTIYKVNSTKKDEDKIEDKEFYNEAINTAVDLKP